VEVTNTHVRSDGDHRLSNVCLYNNALILNGAGQHGDHPSLHTHNRSSEA